MTSGYHFFSRAWTFSLRESGVSWGVTGQVFWRMISPVSQPLST